MIGKMLVALEVGAYMPERAHDTDAGLDLRAPMNICAVIHPHQSVVIDTGVHVQLPKGCYGRIASKSGMNVKYSIVNEGVIDEGYTGTICVKLYNHGNEPYIIDSGDKITQLIVERYYKPKIVNTSILHFRKTERGNGGFGSTGTK